MASYLVAILAGTWVALIGLAIALVLALVRIRRSERRYARLVGNASSEGMEQILLEHIEQIQANQTEIERLSSAVGSLDAAQVRAIQRVGLVRFNPFDDMGGQYSFALALADGVGSGVVLCSLHGRGNTRMYAKPIVNWDSPVQLGEEEQQAVSMLRSDGRPKEGS